MSRDVEEIIRGGLSGAVRQMCGGVGADSEDDAGESSSTTTRNDAGSTPAASTIKKLRNESSAEGKEIWAAVDAAASRAPEWIKKGAKSSSSFTQSVVVTDEMLRSFDNPVTMLREIAEANWIDTKAHMGIRFVMDLSEDRGERYHVEVYQDQD